MSATAMTRRRLTKPRAAPCQYYIALAGRCHLGCRWQTPSTSGLRSRRRVYFGRRCDDEVPFPSGRDAGGGSLARAQLCKQG